MKLRSLLATLTLTTILGGALAAQSTLGSLFDRYDVKANFAQPPAGQTWGASTTSVAADGKGKVVVMVRTAPYIRVFTTEGAPVKAWGDAGLFNLAHSVHFAPDGSVWATDPNAHVVHKFSADGKMVLTLGKKGVAGDNASRDSFNQPNALGFAANGDVYVSDGYVNSRIVHFTADGKFVRIIGGTKGSAPGELQIPRSEEHTSELQSRLHLVCRLLLEKKKKKKNHNHKIKQNKNKHKQHNNAQIQN